MNKVIFSNNYVDVNVDSHLYILPCLLIGKFPSIDADEELGFPAYRGWAIQIGVLCFTITINF